MDTPAAFEPPEGLLAPILTPFNADSTVAHDLFLDHATRLLGEGCVGLVPFGTTGEASSIGQGERIAALDALVAGGIDPRRLVVGAGTNNVPDAVELIDHAAAIGCRAVLLLPPHYYKNPPVDGVVDHFDAILRRCDPAVAVLLYHIPQVAGVGFAPATVARLRHARPDRIVGIKDSSGDWDNTSALFDIDGLTVYPGSETWLRSALDRGGPGCISATANVNAGLIVEVIRQIRAGGDESDEAHSEMIRRRRTIEQFSPIPAQKELLARWTDEPRWRNVRPPLRSMSHDRASELAEAHQPWRRPVDVRDRP